VFLNAQFSVDSFYVGPFSVGHVIVCLSIYGFKLPLCPSNVSNEIVYLKLKKSAALKVIMVLWTYRLQIVQDLWTD
jgi:hypothetical protein